MATKLQTTALLNVRSAPSSTASIVTVLPQGTVVDTDDAQWKLVTLPNGTKGYCAAAYLGPVTTPPPVQWSAPVPTDCFTLTQTYLNEDWTLYPKFGHHTGADYGPHGKTNVPLLAVANGEVVYRDVASSAWGKTLGNHFALYIPTVDKSFLYCHLAGNPPALGPITVGTPMGIMGATGLVTGTHLHLEGWHGRFAIASRTFTSLNDITQKTFDPDAFIRSKLV